MLTAVLAGLLVLTGCEGSPAPLVGRPAPDFALNDLDGNPVNLRDLRGKVVVLNFWATWCPPCRAEMPEIEAIHQQYKDKGVTVIGIDIRETVAEVRDFIEDGGLSWTFVIDRTGAVAAGYAVSAIPTSFFIDAAGIVRAIEVGAMTKGGMESRLARALDP